MRRNTRLYVLILAGILGTITGLTIHHYLATAEAETQTLVARQDIPKGAVLMPDMLVVKGVPQSTLGDVAPVTADAVVKRVAIADIRKDAPIDARMLSEGLPIPKGMRAVTVAVDPVISVGGFALPGCKVDVIATYRRTDEVSTRTILQNVQLLALGISVEPGGGNGASAPQPDKNNATLLVWPFEAEKLILADNQGKLRLVLRSPGDSSQIVTSGIVESTRANTRKPSAAEIRTDCPPSVGRVIRPGTPVTPVFVGPGPAPLRDPPSTIEVIRGNQKSNEVVTKAKT